VLQLNLYLYPYTTFITNDITSTMPSQVPAPKVQPWKAHWPPANPADVDAKNAASSHGVKQGDVFVSPGATIGRPKNAAAGQNTEA
jgi:hypothetical protein